MIAYENKKGYSIPRIIQGKSSVRDYIASFNNWKLAALARKWSLLEGYFISTFIGGLKEEIKTMVQMYEPQILPKAKALAKL